MAKSQGNTMIIKYYVKYNLLKTPCPNGIDARVGSTMCINCEYYKGMYEDKYPFTKKIQCSYKLVTVSGTKQA